MKKFLAALLCAIVAVLGVAGFAACTDNGANSASSSTADSTATDSSDDTTRYSYTMCMPDGAPALAAAMLMAEDTDLGADMTYTVVDSGSIQNCVTGNSPTADVCILPVNAAAKLLGTGETYQLLGTVTHGNLYLMSKNNTEEITLENLSTLVGKTVGVVNLAAVPGLTFEVILNDNNIDYNIVGNSGATSETAVNLMSISSDNVKQEISGYMDEYDYFVVPEPAATMLTKALSLNNVGSLQNLYGSENGYPQAVMVAKKSVIEQDADFITTLMSQMTVAATWVKTADVDTIVAAINAHYDTTSSLSANNLSTTVIENCAISFTPAADCKTEIQSFLAKYAQVATDGATYETADAFYYGYSA